MKNLLFIIKQYLKMFIQKVILPFVYFLNKCRKIQNDLVIFADARHDDIPFSLEALYKEVKLRGYTVIPFTDNLSNLSYIRSVFRMMHFMRYYAAAKYVFICDYYLPVSACNKKNGTIVIQTWHAGGLMKKFGYDSPEDIPPFYKGNVFKNYNLVTASAPICKDIMTLNMKQPAGVVAATGLSRTDRFYDTNYLSKCRKNFFNQYPQARGRKVVLWAPTFRGNAASPYLVGTETVMSLQDNFGKDWYVIIKAHPHIDAQQQISNCSIPTDELLAVTDLLISDYSSIFYDYIIFQKPVVLFVPDLAQYNENRGLYIDYDTLPGPVITDSEALTEAVRNEYTNYSPSKLRECYELYMGMCDGNATERILTKINLN